MNGISGIMTKIIDQDTAFDLDHSMKEVPTLVEMTCGSIFVSPKGYGECGAQDGYGCPIKVEVWQGELRVIVWGDINQEDPTHIISLEGAKEDKRKDNA